MPRLERLDALLDIASGPVLVNTNATPMLSAMHLQSKRSSDRLISLSWDYEDVEFKFEVFCISTSDLNSVERDDLEEVGHLPDFASVSCLHRTSWVRPASPGEVPETFEPLIEESGREASVPASAVSQATYLYGVAFMNRNCDPVLVIAIDELRSYSLRLTSVAAEMDALMASSDVVQLAHPKLQWLS